MKGLFAKERLRAVLVFDALLLACMVGVYFYLRGQTEATMWQGPIRTSPAMSFVLAMTGVLLGGSGTMTMANRAMRGEVRLRPGDSVTRWLWITFAGGFIFLVLQSFELRRFAFEEGFTLMDNPAGSPVFGFFFYLFVLSHLLHVALALLSLLWVLRRSLREVVQAETVGAVGLLWQWVVVMWLVLVVVVYLGGMQGV